MILRILFWVAPIFSFYIGQCHSQILWQLNNEHVIPWLYNDGDEFNGSSIDTSKWEDAYPWGRSLYCSRDNHYYTEYKNCKLADGILTLEARREKIHARAVPYEADSFKLVCDGNDLGFNLRTFDYTCGMIFSKQKYHYGYYEIRFKSQQGKGLWPAFWLFAGHENDEIDIFEMNGSHNNDFHVDVHCKSGCKNYKTTLGLVRKNWGTYLTTSVDWQDGFNVIGAEWQTGFVKWYLNGKTIAYWKGNFEYPMWVIADMALARDNGPFGPGPDASTKFPATFDIDYIRIWNRTEQNSTKAKSQSVNLSPSGETGKAILVKAKKPESRKKIRKENDGFILFSPGENKNYFIELIGLSEQNLTIVVTGSSGKQLYASNDPSVTLHTFYAKDKGKLKIRTGDYLIEYEF